MEFVNGPKPETIDLHVKVDRAELGHIIYDIQNGCGEDNLYTATDEFLAYLKGL